MSTLPSTSDRLMVSSTLGRGVWLSQIPFALELARRECPRQVPGQVDDEVTTEWLHRRGTYYSEPTLTERSTNGIDKSSKRRVILDAAVRVFARKGYHTCRVGDIAEVKRLLRGDPSGRLHVIRVVGEDLAFDTVL